MRTSNIEKPRQKQHSVPEFILNNFSISGKDGQIYVLDKQTQKLYISNVDDVAEEGFYNFESRGVIKTIESTILNELDNSTSLVVEKIIQEESLGNLNENERLLLSRYIIVQIFRVEIIREAITEYCKEKKTSIDEKKIKKLSIWITDRSEKYASFINDKTWWLFKTSESNPFYISDNPVTWQNIKGYGSRSTISWDLGIAAERTQIYFPISKLLSLGFFCRNYEKRIRYGYSPKQYEILKNNKPDIAERVEQLMSGLETGCAVPILEEEVINQNISQYNLSLRKIYSSIDKFD
jgi:hypothetical protein